MPGFGGFALSHSGDHNALGRWVEDMGELLRWEGDTLGQSRFADGRVFNVSAHNRFGTADVSCHCSDAVCVWVDGEILEGGDAVSSFVRVDAGTLAKRYVKDKSMAFLPDLEGHFCATIYDRKNKQILLLSDRYGLRHLYYSAFSNGFAWATQTKAFTAVSTLALNIDPEAIDEFTDLGYLLEDRTWFREVKLIPSASVLTYDMAKQTISSRRYWWWDQIKVYEGRVDLNEIADELANRFEVAVRRRCLTEYEEIGLTLSGGLDSRFILAALPRRNWPIQALTFGIPGCDDVRFAALAAKVKGAEHETFALDAGNWLRPRFGGVWRTDGQLSLQHMHGLEASDCMRSLFTINMAGFAGDLILGGSYLTDADCLDRSVVPGYAMRMMNCGSLRLKIGPEYSNLGKMDYYFLQNRVRRFTYNGTLLFEDAIHFRKPFLDRRLIELAYGLPDKLRFHGGIYRLALLRKFPEYFRTIPWQKTGAAITEPGHIGDFLELGRRGLHRIERFTNRFVGGRHHQASYTNYDEWLRREPAYSIFESLLFSKSALYPEYVRADAVKADWVAHLDGVDRSEKLCRYLTLEIWLRQIFEKQYRNGYQLA